MIIKTVYMDDVAEKVENINPKLYDNLCVVLGLANIKGFAHINNDYLFIVDSEENYQKIKELYPQYYGFIMAARVDFNGYLNSYDGGEFYKTSARFEIGIGDCINSLFHAICCNNGSELDLKAIFDTWGNNKIPKIHMSSPKSDKEFRSHSDYIDINYCKDFLQQAEPYTYDIMIESKKKDLAVEKFKIDYLNIK